jgi:hypothetical protein
VKKNCKEILTIRDIINSLNNVMTRSSNLDLDSEVIITDMNFQEFEIAGVSTGQDFYGQDRVRMYLKPKEVISDYKEDKQIIQHEILGKEIETRLEDSEVKEEAQEVTSSNWWDKYK